MRAVERVHLGIATDISGGTGNFRNQEQMQQNRKHHCRYGNLFSGPVHASSYEKSDETDLNFGTIEFPLFQGSYTLIAIGHRIKDDTATISSPYLVTFNNNVTDIFYKTQQLNVTNTTPLNFTMELDRATSAVEIHSTDNIPTSAKTITYYFHEGGVTLNPGTGLATNNTGYSSSFDIPAENYGGTAQMCRMILLNSDPQEMDLTVTIKGDNNIILATHNFSQLQMKPGYKIIITGPIFASNNTGTFTFNSEWLGTNSYNYNGSGLTQAK